MRVSNVIDSTKTSIFEEMDMQLMTNPKPSSYFIELMESYDFELNPPLNIFTEMLLTEQPLEHHPEGNVFNHTMLSVDLAAKVKDRSMNPRVLMWGALLHDMGKPATTKIINGRITSRGHEIVGEKLAIEFLEHFTNDRDFIYDVSQMVRWHMQVRFVVNNMPGRDIDNMLKNVHLDEIALLGFCDKGGRKNAVLSKEQKIVDDFINKVLTYTKGVKSF